MFSNTKLYFLQFLSENKLRDMGEDMDNFNKYTLSYLKKNYLRHCERHAVDIQRMSLK